MKTPTQFVLTIRPKFVLAVAALLLCSASVFADEPVCKSKGKAVRVVYPDLARRMKIEGIVRLQLQLNSAGSVRDSKVLGGNPVLASAAQEAVRQVRFEGSDSCIVVFDFKQ